MKKKTIAVMAVSTLCVFGFATGAKAYGGDHCARGGFTQNRHHDWQINYQTQTDAQRELRNNAVETEAPVQNVAVPTPVYTETPATNPCPQGHEDCDGIHNTNCPQGHENCDGIHNTSCSQGHANCNGIHAQDGSGAHHGAGHGGHHRQR